MPETHATLDDTGCDHDADLVWTSDGCTMPVDSTEGGICWTHTYAHNLGVFPQDAADVLERFNGDFMAAGEQLSESFAAGALSGEGSNDGSEEGSDEGSSGEEEVLPDKPVAR